MTRATIKEVISCSHSERGYDAQNLLHGTSDKRSKWHGKAGGKLNSVVLKLDREYKFTNFHVGNANSALIEIFVARSSDSQESFQVIVPSTSFMTQMESRNGRPGDRVRIFGEADMIPSVMNQKWDVVKVMCHQPFNDHVAFGLGFFKVEGDADEEIVASPLKSQSNVPSISMKFLDEDTSLTCSQTLSTGSLFEQRDQMKKDRDDYERRQKEERRKIEIYKEEKKKHKNDSKKPVGPKATSPKPATPKPVKKPEPKKKIELSDEDDIEVLDSPTTSTQVPKRRFNDGGDSPAKKPKRGVVIESSDEEDEAEDRPSTQAWDSSNSQRPGNGAGIADLLKGVCFSFSGYQNPMRSDLRDKALEMGAKYCNVLTPECTHLVSAFKNTPKMKAIGRNAVAVSGRWIRRCYAEKKRLPESKYPVSM
ncbi:hypothetical protein L596_007723 [Steinernema carpocapsae]|uniref:BRCT domain-containing protein n=1 Tax=Steinernema carpocapsae TaxID=34508 RepID=A0A4U5PA83_STECR|nr:hypothetical protein L596_007723 [Steinernema carpocapsae]